MDIDSQIVSQNIFLIKMNAIIWINYLLIYSELLINSFNQNIYIFWLSTNWSDIF